MDNRDHSDNSFDPEEFEQQEYEQPFYQKWWFILIVILIALLLICLRYFQVSSSNVDVTESETSEIAAETGTYENGEIIAEQVLYDGDGIVVTATGNVEISDYNYRVELEIENGSDETIEISPALGSVNGHMIAMGLDGEIEAGSETVEDLFFLMEDMESYGIGTVMEIEFCIEISEPDTGNIIETTDPITITTSEYDSSALESAMEEYDDSGTTLYEENGLKIIYKSISEDDDNIYLEFYFENSSGQNATFSLENMTVNGNTVSVWNSYINVADGKVDLDSVRVHKISLSEYGIEDLSDIETIEASFVIYEPETREVIAEPDAFRISF